MFKEESELCPNCMMPYKGNGICSNCGYSKTDETADDKNYLSRGATLKEGRYLVGEITQKNGEGATYAGFDRQNKEACWIREYFPTKLARRVKKSGRVLPREGCGAQFKALVSDFMDVCNEVKRLSVTERVIPIRDEFVDNNTLYVIYKKMNVISLEEYLLEKGGKLHINEAIELILPFCNMIGNIHGYGYIHRGISPYTVYVDNNGELYLGAFSLGAARTAKSELEAELFNGYSAPEQYASNGWQGAWTDVYAVAALFYRMVSGFVPPKSTLVDNGRPISMLSDIIAQIPENISEAVHEAMIANAEDRTQSIYGFISKLIDTEISNTAVYDTNRTRLRQGGHTQKDGGFKYAIGAMILTVVVLLGGLWLVMTTFFPQMMDQSSSSRSEKPATESSDLVIEDDSSEEDPDTSSSEVNPNVPSFIGKTLSEVRSNEEYIGRYDFTIKEEYNDDFPESFIFNQSPAENTPMPGRGAVILYVSRGSEIIAMPDLIGKEFDDALWILGENNLSCEKIDRHVQDAAPGTVVGTIPGPGETFNPRKQQISVFVMPGQDESEQQSSKSSGSSKSSSSSKKSSGSSDGGISVKQ